MNRVLQEAEYILNTKDTIRNVATKFKVSKSTVHKDMNERLEHLSLELYNQIRLILDEHLKIRHIKGGESTKIKFLKA